MFLQASLAVSALLLTLAITPLCCGICRRIGWVDQPDLRRKHQAPVPRTGGIAIFVGYAAALGLLFFLPPSEDRRAIGPILPFIWALLPAILVAFVTGLLDDLLDLPPWVKFLSQILAAALACNAGVQISNLGGYSLAKTWWHIPLTIFWLVACSNAFNLIDGLDGLATGIGLIATSTAFLSAFISGNIALALVTAPLLGALLGFLPYNFSPASIFMGDCGSNTVGFLLGCLAVIWSQKSATVLGMAAPLIALGIPLFDTTLAIARRFLRRQPVFGADRDHIHHRLLARGLTPRRAVCVLYACSGVLAALALMLSVSHVGGLVVAAFCGIAAFAIHYLGYEEFEAAGVMVFGGNFRRMLNANLLLRQMEDAIRSAASVDECWTATLINCRSFGLIQATLHSHSRDLTARLAKADPAECWNLSIPLGGADHLDLLLPFHTPHPPATIGLLATSLRTVLAPKLLEFKAQPRANPISSVVAASAGPKS